MGRLSVTLIDVGWGDSILIEFEDDGGNHSYALVDSNDTTYMRSSYIFLKRHFERRKLKLPDDKPVFDFVLLTHAHADHSQGLKSIIRDFGTENFWYPKSLSWAGNADLIRYSNRSSNVVRHQSVDISKVMPDFGGAGMRVLWPEHDGIDSSNENNNSVVLALEHEDVCLVLTGDAEEEVWEEVAGSIPPETRFFKVPHHGSVNGTFGPGDSTPWLDGCPDDAKLGISSHIRPFDHPDPKVIKLFEDEGMEFYRTDEHYHVTFTSDGSDVSVKYSHE